MISRYDGPRAHAGAPRCHARAHQAPAPESSPCENPVQQQPSHPSRQRGPLPPPPRQEPDSTTETAAGIPPSSPRETRIRLDLPTRFHAIAIVGRRAGGIRSGLLECRLCTRPGRSAAGDCLRGKALVGRGAGDDSSWAKAIARPGWTWRSRSWQRHSEARAAARVEAVVPGPARARLDVGDRSSARSGGRRRSSPPWDQRRCPARTTASISVLERRRQAPDARLWRMAGCDPVPAPAPA